MRDLSLRTLGTSAALAALVFVAPLAADEQKPSRPPAYEDLSGIDALDVDPINGGVVYARTDWVAGEGEQAFAIRRTYRPWGGDRSNYGFSWASSLDLHLDVSRDRKEASFQDEDGHRLFFRRTEGGRLVSTSGPTTVVRELADGFSLKVEGRVYRFNAKGYVISRSGPTSLRVTYHYDAQNLLQALEGPWGRLELKRDARGFLRGYVGAGQAVKIGRDAEGNLVKVSHAARNSFETYGYDGSGRLMWLADGQATIGYDFDGQAVYLGGKGIYPVQVRYQRAKEPFHREVRVTRRGQEEIYRFTSDLRSLQHVGPKGEITVREVDTRGRLTRLTGPDGRTVRRTYDAEGRLSTETTPLGLVRYEYEQKLVDRPTRIRLADGREVRFSYDLRGNVTSLTAPSGAITSYVYDAAGRLVQITDPRGAVSKLARDEHGRVIRLDETLLGTTFFKHDALGRLVKVKRPDGRVVEITHGIDGRSTRVVDALGTVNEVFYDARRLPLRIRDEHGHDYVYSYGDRGELLSVSDHGQPHLKFVYDEHGEVKEIRDALGNVTTIERPDPQTLIVTDAANGKRRIELDALGRVVGEERGGQTFRFDYDASTGNLKSRKTPKGADLFRYDEAGRIAAMEGPEGGFAFRYDSAGRLSELQNSKLGRSVHYTYDAAGDRTGMRLPWGEVRYERNVLGHVTGLVLPTKERIEIDVHPDGRREEIRYPNGVKTRFYYKKSRLDAIVTTQGKEILERRVYGYDARGRVSSIEDEQGQRTSYQHDTLGRLTKVSGPQGTREYRYDAAGNRVAEIVGKATTSYEVSSGNRVVSQTGSAGTISYTYTPEGALASRKGPEGTTRYVYDHDQKLTEVLGPKGQKVRYGYAPNGTRLWREDGAGRNYFLHDLGHTVGDLDVKGEVITSYAFAEGDDDVLSARHGEERFYYHYDQVRSVTAITGAKGDLAARYRYGAFGQTQEATGRAAAWNPHRYTSRSFDAATGLYDYRARTYDADLGRFTATDPAGLLGGSNLYAYVGNAPLNYNDPFGLWPEWLDRKVEGAKAWVNRNVVEPVGKVASWTKENVLDPAWEATKSTVKNTVAFGRGFVNGTVGVVKGVYQMVRHPIQTGKALWHAVTHLDETKEMFKAKWEEYKDAWANDPEKFWEMTGHLTAEVAFAVVGPKGVTAVVNAASKTATVARVASTTARVSRTVTAPVARVATRTGETLARAMPRTARVVRAGRVMDRARKVELARRAAQGGNFFQRAGRRVGYVGKDAWNGVRLAATRPGPFAVYAGRKVGRAVPALIAANGRGAYKLIKNGTIPVWIAFKDNITDAIDAYENREAALRDVRGKTKAFLDEAGNLSPTDLARRIDEIGGVYKTYRDRLMEPVHQEGKRLDDALVELDRAVAAGEIPDNTMDARLDAMIEEFGRRRHNTMVSIYDGNREEEHDMFNPSINRTISYQDEIDLLEATKGRVSDPASKALLDARIKDLTELMAYEYDLFKRGDHDLLIAGIAGPPRDENDKPFEDPYGAEGLNAPTATYDEGFDNTAGETTTYEPGLLDSLEEAMEFDRRR